MGKGQLAKAKISGSKQQSEKKAKQEAGNAIVRPNVVPHKAGLCLNGKDGGVSKPLLAQPQSEVVRGDAATTSASGSGVAQVNGKKRSKNKFKQPDFLQSVAAKSSGSAAPATARVAADRNGGAAHAQGQRKGDEKDKEGEKGVLRQPVASGRGGHAAGDASKGVAQQTARQPGPSARQLGGQGTSKGAAAAQLAGKKLGPREAGVPEQVAAGDRWKKRKKQPHGRSQQGKALHEAAPASAPEAAEMPVASEAPTLKVPTTTTPPPKGAAGGANWAALKQVLGVPSDGRGKKRRRPAAAAANAGNVAQPERRPERISDTEGLTRVLAVDCEMVGVGADGLRSSLARVCVVNSAGNVLLDSHVAQKERVTDFRTRFSGIRPSDLVGAPSLEEVQRRVADMFKGRILVGHAITNDLTALLLSHPRKLIRDTARYPPLMRATIPGRRPKPRALRHLALEHLGLTIQAGEHSPVDDARAALYLYQKHRKEWEMHMERGTVSQLKAPGGAQQPGKKAVKTLEELAAADDMVDL